MLLGSMVAVPGNAEDRLRPTLVVLFGARHFVDMDEY